MKVIVDEVKIFKDKADIGYNISTDPKIVSFSSYVDKERGFAQRQYEIELYCIVDQRALIENDISKIEVYTSNNSISHYDAPAKSAFALIDTKDRRLVNDVTFDLVNILENESLKRFEDITFLTRLEPYQNFNQIPARRSNIDKLNDASAFGTTTKFVVEPRKPESSSNRRTVARTGDRYLDLFRSPYFSNLLHPETAYGQQQIEMQNAKASRST